MTIILGWMAASVAVSLFLGAFLVQGHGSPDVLDLTGFDRDPDPAVDLRPAPTTRRSPSSA
jgi:hypothetical protein